MDPTTEARSRLIVALDNLDLNESLALASKLKGHVGIFKINSVFTGGGPEIIGHLFRNAGPVFLDLKFHDIPNTVANYVKTATCFGESYKGERTEPWVSMMTMHVAAGPAAMKAAVEAARTTSVDLRRTPPKILGITVLTSLDDDAAWNVGMTKGVRKTVLDRAKLARDCGLDGLVCSGKEVEAVREVVGTKMKLVVPGIRPAGGSDDDQARVTTPEKAIKAGADYLVVGRSIYGAKDPAKAADDIVAQIQEACRDAKL